MSKNHYVVQEDSPNLVIMPTDKCYEPSAKKPKLNSDVSVEKLPTPTKISNNNVFAKKTVSKLNSGDPSGINYNLIDVRKSKPSPTSWASNFLQSIGGSSSKFSRLLSSASKTPGLRKENTLPEKNESKTTKYTHQLKTNTSSVHPIMDKQPCLPEKPTININFIHPPNQKPAHQPMTTKELSQPKSTSNTNQPKKDISSNSTQVNRLPSLPKNYKIPIHSKCNKPIVQPNKEIIESNNVTNTYHINSDISKNQSLTYKTNNTSIDQKSKRNNLAIPDKAMIKEILHNSFPKHDTKNTHNNTNHDKIQSKTGKTIKELNYEKEVDLFLSKVTKVKKFEARSENEKPKFDLKNIQQPKIQIAQLEKKKETKELKHRKDIKKSKSIKESDLPKSYRNPLPADEIVSPKSYDDAARSKCIKDSKEKNKQETTYSTKLKTKKINNHSKSKHSEETRSNKHQKHSKTKKELTNIQNKTKKAIKKIPTKPLQTSSKKEDISSKLKNKKTTDNDIRETGHSDSENKQNIGTETKTTKNDLTKSYNDERSSKSISPIKSVVRKIKRDLNFNSPKKRHRELKDHNVQCEKPYKEFDRHELNSEIALYRDAEEDLRAKLKHKINKKYFHKLNCKDKFANVPNRKPFIPKENLIISFDAKDGSEETVMAKDEAPPVKKLARKQPPGGKKCKKIKLEINIMFDHADTTDEESIKTEDEANEETLENTDLSFLDDFNVDEIVESLNECKGSSICANKQANFVVSDIKTHGIPTSNSQTIQVNNRNSDLKTQVTNDATTLFGTETPADNIITNHLAMEHEPTTNKRPYRQVKIDWIENKMDPDTNAVVKGSNAGHISAIDFAIVKEEVNMNPSVEIERTDELFNEKSQNGKVCGASYEAAAIKPEIVTPMDTSYEDNIAHDMHVTGSGFKLQADKNIVASNSNTEHDTEKYTNKDSIMEGDCTKTRNTAETKEINNIIEVSKANRTSTFKSTETCNTDTEGKVIIIDDSESENEAQIRNTNKSIPKKSIDILKFDKAKQDTTSDEVIIDPNPATTETSESVLVLDTDYSIDENSNDSSKCQLRLIDQNENGDNLTGSEINTKEIKMNTDDLASYNHTAADSAAELRIENGLEKQGDNNDTMVSPASQVPDKTNSKTSEQCPNPKSTEPDTIVSEKCTPKNGTSSKVIQTDNKMEAEVQSKTNSDTEDKHNETSDAKPNNEINRRLSNDQFARKLGCRLQDVTRQRYTVTEVMRVGKFSKIFKCKSRGSDYAVKVIKNAFDGVQLGVEKLDMLMKLQNGVPEQNLNCVRFLDGFSVYGQWCFLMEYYPGNLKEALIENNGSFHIDMVQALSRQLVSAVTILRNNNIIHSDIKPSHVLINASRTRVKLCGFDQSSYFDGGKLLPNTGTVNYRAPELILGYPAGYGIDVWSTALVMYEMATNRKLFPGIFNNDILYKQLCTLGSIPMEMLMGSTYRHAHFKGTAFAKIINAAGQKVIIEEIIGNDKINSVLFQTYAAEWAQQRNQKVREDKAKIRAFSKLLHSMLAMHPRYRIAIEFVFANPFIYETFDS